MEDLMKIKFINVLELITNLLRDFSSKLKLLNKTLEKIMENEKSKVIHEEIKNTINDLNSILNSINNYFKEV